MAEMEDPSGRDWVHDPDGEKGSEGGRKYGLAVLSKMTTEGEDFPLDAAAFVEEYGDSPVRLNHQRVVSVSEIFEHVDADEFETKVDFHKKVGAALQAADFLDYHPQE
ncbi:DUF5785 family protein [Halobacterium jilantaiense]|uniref:Uncharacterized protein n=1 Tax=Halobacterium jilantaiense TaxID=355548 RepID=A0A1I0MGP9_9EURY|nr:DUF5785 family protein [Halobacterium jilantaiense]SEV87469.1 hypothetical protein SAMN04487945_0050 [Halobacterium jilantaiense]